MIADRPIPSSLQPPVTDHDHELRLDAPPDVRFLDYGHQMTLALKLAPGESPLPKLTLHLNGTLIGQFVSQQVFRGLMASVTVEVPARLLGTRNALQLGWEGDSGSTIGPAVTLLPDSEFYLPRVYRAELPDLGLLQYNLYPFSVQPELEDLAVVIPDPASDPLLSRRCLGSRTQAGGRPSSGAARGRRFGTRGGTEKSVARFAVLPTERSGGLRCANPPRTH